MPTAQPDLTADVLAAIVRHSSNDDPRLWRTVLRFARAHGRRFTAMTAIDRLVALGLGSEQLAVERAHLEEVPARALPPGTGSPPAVPIDAVYLWVDAADPVWSRRFVDAMGFHPAAADDRGIDIRRYEQHGEILFSLRCLQAHAPWVRRVFVVTDGQRFDTSTLPAELRGKLTFVDHSEILPAAVQQPTFNSAVIEAFLDRIPGLAEHFLYLNDDTVIGAPLTPAQVLADDGRPLMWVAPLEWPSAPTAPMLEELARPNDSLAGRIYLSVEAFRRTVGEPPAFDDVHQFRVLTRSAHARFFERFEPVLRTNLLAHQVRRRESVKTCYLSTWFALHEGSGVPVVEPAYRFFGLVTPSFTVEHALVLLALRPLAFCVDVSGREADIFDAFGAAYSAGVPDPSGLPSDPLLDAIGAGATTGTKMWSR